MRVTLFVIGAILSICTAAGINAEKCTEEDLQRKQAWRPFGFVYSPGLLRLHEEIEQFYEYVQLTAIERTLRMRVIDRINSTVRQVWPNAEAKIIGSNIMGLLLPNSDIDLMIVGASGESPIQMLADKLLASDIVEPGSIQIRDNRRIPIIEFIDRESKLDIDMPFHDAVTLQMAALIKEYQREYPVLTKLVLVLKQYLKLRDVNDVFTGGISSHSLTLMATSFLQMHPTYKTNKDNANLGELLLNFFEFYGKKFDYENIGITTENGGQYLPRKELPCDTFNGYYQLFCVKDPYQWVNAAYDAYRASDVKQAFNDAYSILSTNISITQNSINECSDNSLLGRIIYVTDDLIEFRKWVQHNFQHLLKD